MRHYKSLLLAALLAVVPLGSWAAVSVGVSIDIAPPVLPVYEQPPLPGDGYIWMPGYWAYGDEGYFWVPGTWVLSPEPGFLWTPGYWGFVNGGYFWNEGYWGRHVGFYGGVNYGYGYVGTGYAGGYWNHGAFFYNRAVNNVGSVHVTNVYNKTVINNINVTRVSYNGGGGIAARPTPQEQAAARDHRLAPTGGQLQHVRAAASNRELLAKVNHGAPAIGATPKLQTGKLQASKVQAGAGSQAGAGPRTPPGAAAQNAAPARSQVRDDRPPRDQQPSRTVQPARDAQPPREVQQRRAAQPSPKVQPPREVQPPRAAQPPREVQQAPRREESRSAAPKENTPRAAQPPPRREEEKRGDENQH